MVSRVERRRLVRKLTEETIVGVLRRVSTVTRAGVELVKSLGLVTVRADV